MKTNSTSNKGLQTPAKIKNSSNDGSEKDPLQKEKLKKEIDKLRLEVTNLEFQISRHGRASTFVWPIISGGGTLALAIILAVTNISFQQYQKDFQNAQADREQYRTLVSILDAATNATNGPDRRVAGIWALDSYWHAPQWQSQQYENDLTNTLSVLLITDRAKDSPYDDAYAVRLASALVIGDAIRPEDLKDPSRVGRLTKLLYGNRLTWETGSVVRQNWFLKNHPEIQDHETKLSAVEEAIRWNWEHLENTHLAGAVLPGISLRSANLRGAYLAQANLRQADFYGADLEGANLDGADLDGARFEHANLSNASLKDLKNWANISIAGANIKNIDAPAEFIVWAKARGAVENESKVRLR